MNILFEVTVLDGSTPVTLRMAHKGASAAGIQLGGFQWLPAITKRHSITGNWAADGILEQGSLNHGSISFDLGGNDNWSAYDWSGGNARLFYQTAEEGDFSTYKQVFEGTVSSITREGNTGTVGLLGPDALLDKPLLTSEYQGTGGIEGAIGQKGNLKAGAIGLCENIEPTIVDAASWIYQVHAYGPVYSIKVYDFALALDNAKYKGDVADFAALKALTLLPSEWATCLAHGLFRLGAASTKKITADVQAGATTPATIIPQLLRTAGVPDAKIGTMPTGTATWNYYATGTETIGEVARLCAYHAGGMLFADGTGTWHFMDFFAPKAAVVLNADRSTTPLVKSYRELSAAAPIYKARIGHSKAWSVQGTGDISPALLDALENAQTALTTAQDAATTAVWNGVTGTGKPQDNATVGAPDGTPVGDLPASTVTDAIKDGAGNVIKLRDAVPVINAAIDAANGRITTAADAANGRIDAANTRITTAQGIATKAADDLALEIQRATEAEGELHTRIDSVAADGGYDDTAIRTLITDTRTAYADADRALGERINSVQSSFVKGGGNFLSNTDFVTLDGWHIGVNLIGAVPLAKNNAGPDWQPAGFEDTMGTGSDDAVVDQNQYVTIYSEPFAVIPGDWLQFFVMSASHRCRNWVTLFYYDALGNEIAYAGEYMSARWDNGGRNPAHWDQLGAKSVKVPSNAMSARMGLRKYATFPDLTTIRSSVAWWWRPYVGLAREGQTEWNPYVPGNTKQVQARSNAAIDTAQRTGANASQAVADLSTSVTTRFGDVNGAAATLSDRITSVSNATTAIGTRTTNLEVTASAATNTINPNPDFSSWSDPAAGPDLWAAWGTLTPGSWARVANPLNKGGYALDHTPADINSGFARLQIFCGNGWYVMEAAVWKTRGSWNGAGVTLNGQANIDFMGTPDSYDRVGDVGGDGGVRSWSVLFQIRDDYIGAGYKNFHLMTNWEGFGRGFTDKTLRWLRCAIRPATDAEVKAMKADATLNAPGGAMARIGGLETAVTDGRFATAQRATDIETSLNDARGRLSSVETATTDGRFAAASRVSTVESNLSGVSGRVSNVETAVTDGRFASSSRASNLEAQMNATSESNLLARIRGTEAAVTDGRFATAQRASDLESSINGVSGRVSNVETATSDGRFAAASTLNQLRSEYNGTAATVSTQAGTISGLQGRTSAYIETTVVAANNRAQLAIRADANGGAGVDIIGDVAITGQSGGNRTIITGSGIQVYDANNVLRVRIGFW